jgi:DNA-binding IclR family transcriptional regulator
MRAADWAQRTQVALPQDMKEIRRSIADARRHGYLFGGNGMLRGLSAAACPLHGMQHDPLALVVAGASERMNGRRDQIVTALLRQAGVDRGSARRASADGGSCRPARDVA